MSHSPRYFTKQDLSRVFSVAVSMTMLASSLGYLIAASYSTFCEFETEFESCHGRTDICFTLTCYLDGRRPVYLCTLPVFVIGSAGVAAAQSIPSLLFWRFVQSMGASFGPILGAAVIGDIFKLEERGRAMGVFCAVSWLFMQ